MSKYVIRARRNEHEPWSNWAESQDPTTALLQMHSAELAGFEAQILPGNQTMRLLWDELGYLSIRADRLYDKNIRIERKVKKNEQN